MARKPRIHFAGALYHVILRGNDRQDIFFQPSDRRLWETILKASMERHQSGIHCFCWMTNHLHMVIQVDEKPLAATIRNAAEALEEGATTVAEIARRLHRSEAAISQLISRHSAAG